MLDAEPALLAVHGRPSEHCEDSAAALGPRGQRLAARPLRTQVGHVGDGDLPRCCWSLPLLATMAKDSYSGAGTLDSDAPARERVERK
eukprot:6417590-Pyramimonas_sp.AAC.1